MVKTLTDAGATARTTLAAIEAMNPCAVLTERDVLNTRRKHQTEELAGQTEMQALFDELRRTMTRHEAKTDDRGRCTHLLLQPDSANKLIQEFHELVQMDSTYRTNRFDMPLLHIVGRTNTNKTFTMAVCFLRRERTEDYEWALRAFQRLVGDHFRPKTIVTDRALALVNSIASVFPSSRHVLCAWHVAKNIAANCKALFPVRADGATSTMTWEEFSLEWSRLVTQTLDAEEFELR